MAFFSAAGKHGPNIYRALSGKLSADEDTPHRHHRHRRQRGHLPTTANHGDNWHRFHPAVEGLLVVAVILAVLLEVLGSVPGFGDPYHKEFEVANDSFMILFAVEYIARACYLHDRYGYLLSFSGVVDLMSFLPGLLLHGVVLLLPDTSSEGVQARLNLFGQSFRLFRVIRVFRILKLLRFAEDEDHLAEALNNRKSMVFIYGFCFVSLLLASVMYFLEGGEGHFDSIPSCFYWVVVTISTVGYGDVVPATPGGKAFAIVVIVLGYGAIVAQGINAAKRGIQAKDPVASPAAGLLIQSSTTPPRDMLHEKLLDNACPRNTSGLLEAIKADCQRMTPAQRAELLGHLGQLVSQDCMCAARIDCNMQSPVRTVR